MSLETINLEILAAQINKERKKAKKRGTYLTLDQAHELIYKRMFNKSAKRVEWWRVPNKYPNKAKEVKECYNIIDELNIIGGAS